jgi:hypothetical protein
VISHQSFIGRLLTGATLLFAGKRFVTFSVAAVGQRCRRVFL